MLEISRSKASRKGAKALRKTPSFLCAFAPLREAFLFTFLFCISPVQAQSSVGFAPTGDETADFETKVLLSDLYNPAGLAVRPTQAKNGPYELYIAESGAGQVVRFSTRAPEKVEKVIVDFPLGTLGQQPPYRVGPLSLAFISRSKLLVGAKGDGPDADIVASYSLPVSGTPLAASEQEHTVGPLDAGIASRVDDLQFGGLAMTEQTCFMTSGGKDSQGWVLKSSVEANRLGRFAALD